MEEKPLLEVEKLALKKRGVFRENKLAYIMRAALAGMFIGFGLIVAMKTSNYFYVLHSPLAYPAGAITFGSAIILIAYGGGDLFTGNTFYLTSTSLRGVTSWGESLRMWMTSYAGNLLGAFLFAMLVLASGLFADPHSTDFLVAMVEKKMNAPLSELFFRAILCNWLVCLAFFIPMNLQGDGPKMFAMMLFVFGFFISGYEHSIANMSSFAIALVVDHPDTISLWGAVRNLIPVTVGNLIGGGVLMGGVYHYLNRRLKMQAVSGE